MKKQEEIFLALKRKDIDAIEKCLKSTLFNIKADINSKDENGKTLIINAVELQDVNICKFLIDKEADINLTDTDGKPPLWYAIETYDNKLIELLIKNGANVNYQDKNGLTALSFTLNQKEIREEEIKKILDLFFSNRAEINMSIKNGQTLFEMAIEKGALEIALFLIEIDTDDNEISKKSHILIERVISLKDSNNCLNIVDKILSIKKSQLNQSTLDYYLWLSVQNNEAKLINLFLSLGSNITAKVAKDESILQSSEFFSVLSYMEDNELQKFLTINNIDVNKVNSPTGITLLTDAVSNGNKRRVEILFQFGADLNFKDENGNIPLHALSEKTKLEAQFDFLQFEYEKENHDFHYSNSISERALENFKERTKGIDIYANESKIEIAKFLLNHGADINNKNNKYLNPILYSFSKRNIELQHFFISLIGNSSIIDFIIDSDDTKHEHKSLLRNIYFDSLNNLIDLLDLNYVEILLILALRDKKFIYNIDSGDNKEFAENIIFYIQLFYNCLGYKNEGSISIESAKTGLSVLNEIKNPISNNLLNLIAGISYNEKLIKEIPEYSEVCAIAKNELTIRNNPKYDSNYFLNRSEYNLKGPE